MKKAPPFVYMLRTGEMAAALNISVSTLRRMILDGELTWPAVLHSKKGGFYRFDKEKVFAQLGRQQRK